MKRIWRMTSILPAALFALLVVGCQDLDAPQDRLLGPDAASLAKGGNGKGQAVKAAKGPKVKGQKNGATASWELAVGKLVRAKETESEKVIGRSGGYVTTAGHYLWVPKNTVSQPTTFKIRQYNKTAADGSTLVAVDLKATRTEADGTETDVGAGGFGTDSYGNPNKVYLFMTYAWAENAPAKVNDSNSAVLWIRGTTSGGEYDVEPVANTRIGEWGNNNWYVLAPLEHFSDYALAWPF